ncbi:efflux RND transporter periplasmic adaptor subunit [Thalassobaculum litoreum]|uniref:RND family efflux transporter, MFP subunit n=1 Tax=Thalassobaculum litoreum DSM 18839 TaxID=1123362 RepID=A0A8G2F0E2_9PROT|nr:efflux RND transporter periplasmic adaptor subunit [Thalassobaculum litoreum]SDG43901.1 RND family efflux transporter, MFP subunit [Thalassobaculum litoreum DSM 18839]
MPVPARSAALFLGLWALCAVLLPTSDALAQGREASVTVDPVTRQPLIATVNVLGRFVARQSGVLAARVAERVDEVAVQVGDQVKRGDVIARLSSDRLAAERLRTEAQAKAAESDITAERANLAKAQQTLDRLNKLRSSSAHRPDRVEDAERDVEAHRAALRAAEADAAVARAQLDLAEIALQDAAITAPYDGVVTVKHVSAGSYVRLGDPVVTMLNHVELEIEADVPANRTGGLKPGTVVEGELQDGTRLFAVVRAVVPEENTRTRTRAVRFTPQDSSQVGNAANQAITLEVPLDQSRQVLTVNKDAVTVQRGENIVFIVQDGKAVPRSIRLGESVGNRFEVLDGLEDGDLAVVRGNEVLRPGQAVSVGQGQG